MFTRRSISVSVLIVVALMAGLAIFASFAPAALGQGLSGAAGKVVAVEIAENGTRFTPDETPAHPDGLPAYGGEFITEGYIYPDGTITCTDNACDGVLPDGSPQFPDLVMGTWTCRGWHVGDGAHTGSGPIIVTPQIFDFGNEPGAKTIVTDGFELADFNVEVQRAITGGTGRYRNVRGEQIQELLGWNDSIGVSLRVELKSTGG